MMRQAAATMRQLGSPGFQHKDESATVGRMGCDLIPSMVDLAEQNAGDYEKVALDTYKAQSHPAPTAESAQETAPPPLTYLGMDDPMIYDQIMFEDTYASL
jgi:hypothetical protein